ncbi:MAG TPA: TadE/TadG family type IV pilus assembly protein [Terrimesophilobacter sp.]|nr:TadE/TadG family type IV pilus assembly protein [Terrimesophilobacter sp.]
MRSRLRARAGNDAGTVTAEFAAVVPAVILILVVCLATVHLAGRRLILQDAASDTARILARGEPSVAAERARQLVPGVRVGRQSRDGMVCAILSAPAAVAGGVLGAVTLSASSCALAPAW